MKSDKKNSDRNLNRDINRNAINERFPESKMTKDSRKDFDKMQEEDLAHESDPDQFSGSSGNTEATSSLRSNNALTGRQTNQ